MWLECVKSLMVVRVVPYFKPIVVQKLYHLGMLLDSDTDYKERGFWDEYQTAYEEALSRCSTEEAPWFVIPADHKWVRDLAVSRILVELLEGLNQTFPLPKVDLEHIREEYHSAKEGTGHN